MQANGSAGEPGPSAAILGVKTGGGHRAVCVGPTGPSAGDCPTDVVSKVDTLAAAYISKELIHIEAFKGLVQIVKNLDARVQALEATQEGLPTPEDAE